MTRAAATADALDFAHRVLRCGVLSGFELAAFWSTPGSLEVMARHTYGPWRSVKVKKAVGRFAESEGGSTVLASDIAVRLRNALKDRPSDKRHRPR